MEPNEEIDPAQHLLSLQRYTRGPDGTQIVRPVSLAEAAQLWGAVLKSGLATEDRIRFADDETASVGKPLTAISKARAEVITSMLDELALRLQPGRTVGPIADGSLGALAHEVALGLRWMAA